MSKRPKKRAPVDGGIVRRAKKSEQEKPIKIERKFDTPINPEGKRKNPLKKFTFDKEQVRVITGQVWHEYQDWAREVTSGNPVGYRKIVAEVRARTDKQAQEPIIRSHIDLLAKQRRTPPVKRKLTKMDPSARSLGPVPVEASRVCPRCKATAASVVVKVFDYEAQKLSGGTCYKQETRCESCVNTPTPPLEIVNE